MEKTVFKKWYVKVESLLMVLFYYSFIKIKTIQAKLLIQFKSFLISCET